MSQKTTAVRPLLIAALTAISLLFAASNVIAQRVEVEVESVTLAPGDHNYFRIFLNNDIPISALNIPLNLPSLDLVVDSVSFRYTVAHEFRLNSRFNNNNRRDFISILPPLTHIPTIESPGGEICRVYFQVDGFAPAGAIPIDTFINTIVVGDIQVVQQLDASDELGTLIVPTFRPGEIVINRPVDEDTTSQEEGPADALPTSFALRQNYPNPFNPSTRITFSVPYASYISLSVYDGVGREIELLAQGTYPPGTYSHEWNASDYASGVYFYKLSTPDGILSRKMVVIK